MSHHVPIAAKPISSNSQQHPLIAAKPAPIAAIPVIVIYIKFKLINDVLLQLPFQNTGQTIL